MGGAADAVAEARRFVERHGEQFGLVWDGERGLSTGLRADNGESAGVRENRSSFFRQGQTAGQPMALDRYESFELFESVFAPRGLWGEPASDARRDLREKRLVDAISSLRTTDKLLLQMRFGWGLTLEEIGREMHITYQAVQWRLRNVVKGLRSLADEALAPVPAEGPAGADEEAA